jgi:hypothetical protein
MNFNSLDNCSFKCVYLVDLHHEQNLKYLCPEMFPLRFTNLRFVMPNLK